MRRIKKYLSRSVTESVVHAFINSRVDYCNSLLYGLPNSHIIKFQRIQNAAAQLAAAWLAQLGERRSAEREVAGSNPGRTNTQGL